MVVTKFEDIEKGFNEIAEQYKIAKENNDESLISKLKEQYEKQRRLLYSNEYYFANLTRKKARKYSEKVQKELLNQKRTYKNNILYIDMIESSDSIDSYIENQSEYVKNIDKNANKKRNFVKRHFKKFLIGGTIALLVGGLFGLKSFNKSNKDKNKTNIESTTTETNNSNLKDNNIQNEEYKTTENDNIYESTTEYYNDVNTKEEDNKSNKEKSISTKSETTITSLDPGVSNSNDTKTTIIRDESLKEPTAVDYIPLESFIGYFNNVEFGPSIIIREEHEFLDNPSIIDENANPSNPKDDEDIIINEEKPGETDTNVPIEEDESTQEDKKEESTDKDNTQIPEKEQETIIEKEEQTDIDNPTKIEDNTTTEEDKKEESTDKDNTEVPEKEQETITETEEKTDIDNPTEIEEDIATPTDASTYDLSKEDLECYREILDEINNSTEIGKSYTLHI